MIKYSSCIERMEQIKVEKVEVCDFIDQQRFRQVLDKGEPVIMKNCSFGNCMRRWNLDYLNKVLGDDDVVTHESSDTDLKFLDKNFSYKTCKFSDFVKKLIDPNSHTSVYLRSTNKNPRAKRQARIEDDFPVLADDLKPPPFIPYGHDSELYHSSVLRIASRQVQIWTHFDLYDNVLCQVVGTKRIILFPPEDTRYLYIKGDKSEVNCFDDWSECIEKFPLMANTQPRLCHLEPGDCLYLPSLWWHNIKSLQGVEQTNSTGCTIGFNIFWKDEKIASKSLYSDVDVYGNKNLPLFDASLTNMNKAVQNLNKLPEKYSKFYKVMLLEQMRDKLL